MKNKLPLSLIIVTMNRPDSLSSTLKSFFSFTEIPSEVVVVDQSTSTDFINKNKNSLNTYSNYCDCIYVYQQNPSITEARNRGINYVHNDIVLFSDDDIEINKETIKNLFHLMNNPDISMVGGYNELSKPSKGVAGYLLGFKSFKNRKIGHVTKSMFGRFPVKLNKETPTMWAMGFFSCYKK